MRMRTVLALVVALMLTAPAAAWARTAVIELAAPVQGQTDESIRAALHDAIEQAAQGAAAMGLPYIDVQDAQMIGDSVAVQMLASDAPLEPGQGHDSSTMEPDASTTAYQPIQ